MTPGALDENGTCRSDPAFVGPPAVVFLLAPSGRSGTNYLYHLLTEVGLCRDPVRRVAEDFLVEHADLLVEYARRTTERWAKWLSKDEVERRSRILVAAIGRGVLAGMGEQAKSTVPALFKSPSARNLASALEVFPEAAILLLVRDGRDVAESMLRSGFRRNFLTAAFRWSQRAEEIVRFLRGRGPQPRSRFLLVRFENVAQDPQTELRAIAELLGVRWTGDAAPDLPVYGSSQVHSEQGFRWQIKDRPASFEPVARWRQWGVFKRLVFHVLAGRQLLSLGYESDPSWWLRGTATARSAEE